ACRAHLYIQNSHPLLHHEVDSPRCSILERTVHTEKKARAKLPLSRPVPNIVLYCLSISYNHNVLSILFRKRTFVLNFNPVMSTFLPTSVGMSIRSSEKSSRSMIVS